MKPDNITFAHRGITVHLSPVVVVVVVVVLYSYYSNNCKERESYNVMKYFGW